MCNAWNHPPGCNCGWGGGYGSVGWGGGYGSGGGGARWYSHTLSDPNVAMGGAWKLGASGAAKAFVNPNALCPVCGKPVFFYESPIGGRVFFDSLGPPWPKHPCTARGLDQIAKTSTALPFGYSNDRIRASGEGTPSQTTMSESGARLAATYRGEWQPLLADEEPETIWNQPRIRRLAWPRLLLMPFPWLYLPVDWVGTGPVLWRWMPGDWRKAGEIELSGISTEWDQARERRAVLPIWIRNEDELSDWQAGRLKEPGPEHLLQIGWSRSFAWAARLKGESRRALLAMGQRGVDLSLAFACFERAAEAGLWQAMVNLGVMLRDGLGVERDLVRAFRLFQTAAASCDPVPLRHLARCHSSGEGCKRDSKEGDRLVSLALAGENMPAYHPALGAAAG